jgi:transposase
MARTRYSEEFKRSAVALVLEQNYSAAKAAKSLGVNITTLRYWLAEHRRRGGPVSAAEEKDLRRRNAELERQVQQLTVEREILKKAAAFFAREQP